MRVVLDTNIVISGIFWKGAPYRVLQAWIHDKYELIVSEEILSEYSRVLSEFEKRQKDTSGLAKSWTLFIAQNSHLIRVKKKVKVCRDPFDDMFLSCAIAAKAKIIVSGDNDLLSMQEYMSVKIICAHDFLSLIAERSLP